MAVPRRSLPPLTSAPSGGRRPGGRWVPLLFAVVAALSLLAAPAAAQVSPRAQEELRQRGITPEEALEQAERAGVDTSSPEALERTARERGFSEETIAELRRLLEERQRQPSPFERRILLDPAVGRDTLRVANADSLLTDSLATDSAAVARKREKLELRRQQGRDADLVDEETGLEFFGYRTFRNADASLEQADLQPADEAYVVSPGDELRLSVYGAAEFAYDLTVDREGRINIPTVGQLTVAGTTLGELEGRMRAALSSRYSGIRSNPPTVFVDVTVTRLRPVRVFVTGEVERPGAYQIGSGASVFNLLYSVGGPTIRGSLRNIQVSRGGEIVGTIDAYDYLIEGREPAGIRLQTNDRILVPIRGKTVYIEGAVNRPAIYEMLDSERFEDLLRFAGGLRPEAYVARFQVERIIPFTERRDPTIAREVLDLDLRAVLSEISDYAVADGDRVTVFSITEADEAARRRLLNAVAVEGAVFQPGRYELGGDLLTVRDLVEQAAGLTGDAYRARAELVRTRPDLRRELIPLDLDRVLADDPTQNLPLSRGDSLYVFSEREFEQTRYVSVEGQVLNPGQYPFLEQMTVYDLLFQGGGLLDPEFRRTVFLRRADLFRLGEDGATLQIIPFDLEETLAGRGAADVPLTPFDSIRVYPVDVEVLRDRFVVIEGAVKDPGRYALAENMTVQDLILQAGGFVEGAYAELVEVTRMASDGAERRAETFEVALGGAADPTSALLPGSHVLTSGTFPLQHRDQVYVRLDPRFRPQQTVTLRGEVRFPGTYTLLRENERLSEVVERAGGLTPRAYARGGQLVRNEQQLIIELDRAVAGERRADVPLLPGDVVTIPLKPNTVDVRGAVANEGLIQHVPGRRVSYYLDRAGGLGDNAQAVFVTQASGATFKLRRGLFAQNPVVDDGAVIYVAPEPERTGEGSDLSETLRDSLAIVASAATVIVPLIVALSQ